MLRCTDAELKRSIGFLIIPLVIRVICIVLVFKRSSADSVAFALTILSALYYITPVILLGFAKKLHINRGIITIAYGIELLLIVLIDFWLSYTIGQIIGAALLAPHKIVIDILNILEDRFAFEMLPNWVVSSAFVCVYGLLLGVGMLLSVFFKRNSKTD